MRSSAHDLATPTGARHGPMHPPASLVEALDTAYRFAVCVAGGHGRAAQLLQGTLSTDGPVGGAEGDARRELLRRIVVIVLAEPPRPSGEPMRGATAAELGPGGVVAMLRGLPPLERCAAALRWVGGCGSAEVATLLGVGLDEARELLVRGRRALRRLDPAVDTETGSRAVAAAGG